MFLNLGTNMMGSQYDLFDHFRLYLLVSKVAIETKLNMKYKQNVIRLFP